MFNWSSWSSHRSSRSSRKLRHSGAPLPEQLEERTLLTAPTVVNDFQLIDEDNAYAGSVAPLANDVDGDPLTFSVVNTPQHGTLQLQANGSYTYTPDANYSGVDSFTFRAYDGTNYSNSGTVSLSISAINDGPTIIDDFEMVQKNTELAGNLSLLAVDNDQDILTYTIVQQPTNGMLNVLADGTYTYTPNANFVGGDSFTFRVNDGTLDSNIATVNLNVVQNNAPAVQDGFANPDEDFTYPGNLTLLGADPDGNTLTYSLVAQPTNGTVTLNANGTFTYTPTANYFGTDSFAYRAFDGLNYSNVGVFNFNISPVDDQLRLTFPSGTPVVQRTSTPVRIDPAATVTDLDSVVDFRNARIRAVVVSGNTNGDNQHGRISLRILDQGPGPNTVTLSKGSVFYNGNNIATYSGGTVGRSLIIQFRNNANVTEEAVNAVLRQISLQASKKASSTTINNQTGIRLVDITISAGGQKTVATKTVSVV